MIAAMLTGLAMSATMPDRPPCPASQWGARVGAVTRIPGPRGTRAVTRSGQTPQPLAIAEGDILCAGEMVTNPRGSGVRVAVNLPGGREVTLAPGSQTSIPSLGLISRLAALVGQFDRLFSADAYQGGEVRGGGEDDGEEQLTRAVPAWGPRPVAWHAHEEDGGSWRVQLIENGRTRIADVSRPFALIDLSNGCGTGCSIVVRGRGGRIVQRLRVIPTTPADVPLPRWLDRVGEGEAERALLGAWLANRLGDPAWVGQGHALMWGSACSYPAVFAHLARQFQTITAGEPCVARRLTFRDV